MNESIPSFINSFLRPLSFSPSVRLSIHPYIHPSIHPSIQQLVSYLWINRLRSTSRID